MKILKLLLIFTLMFSSIAEEFKFKQPTLQEYMTVKSYEDEIITIGGIDIRRGDLLESSRVNHEIINCDGPKKTSLFDEPAFQTSLNIALVATVLHTTLQAPEDKKKHALVGAVIGLGATKLCEKIYNGDDNRLICALTGAGAALLAGLGKEVYDSGGRGNVDAMDAVYTFVPGALISFKF
ncbi:hypothetical protein [Bacteriovorax sp. Seq25_V]|uniref:hypothetical protein n=1 Tax=Bacteriovorax sp. Seq25_V TaxID=1201288 RepID=UPI00038A2F3F|nr:hypothetical protein [Bacteriovorax sp. Seq25_V]EQC44035.1 hypothetical protein M900_1441 [Bacteriovorax sp. Seq25_V]